MPERLIITIDGPAGTGKSSVARTLARRLGLDFLDTGAMYRAAAAIALDAGLDPRSDPAAVVAAVAREDLHFDWTTDPPDLQRRGVSLMVRIREPDVTRVVSGVAGIGELRHTMVRKQRIIAQQHPRLVTEGRDEGSVVFPDADVKFYLDASPDVRAARRAEQLRAAGYCPDEAALLDEIVARDASDSGGTSDGPLVCPADAVRIDTSRLAFDDVVDALERAVRGRVAAGEFPTHPRDAGADRA